MGGMTRTRFVVAVIVVFSGFFVFGLSENVRGPAIPVVQTDFRLGEWQIGLLLAINSLGYLAACGYTASLIKRIGINLTLILAFGGMVLSGVCISLSNTFGLFTASYFLLYLGNGMLEIGLGIIAAKLFVNRAATWMNLSHFFYGLSSMIAPLAAVSLMGATFGSGAAAQALGWRGMYLLVLASSLIPLLLTLMMRLPRPGKGEVAAASETAVPFRRDMTLWLIVAVLSLAISAEMAVGGWLVITLNKSFRIGLEEAAWFLMGFYGCFTAARLLFGPLIDRFGLLRSILWCGLWAGGTTGAGLAAGAFGMNGAWLLAAAGFGIAPIYPTVMAVLAKLYAKRIEPVMTLVLTIMSFAIVAGSLVIGAVTDWAVDVSTEAAGYMIGYSVIAVCCLASAAVTFMLLRRLARTGEVI